MQVQETITNETTNLSGSTAAVLIAVITVAAFALGADLVTDLFEVRLPARQLLMGRSLQTLTLSCRFFCVLAGSYMSARLTPCDPSRAVQVCKPHGR
ncbi:MAG: hypothetical protein WD795_02555 [Woeseia sp.]